MQVQVQKITNESLMNECLEYSLPIDQIKKLKVKLKTVYKTEHSPIYSQIFVIKLHAIPSFVHVHLRTHKKEFIFESARTFRSDKTEVKQDRNTPTDMIIICNAKKIIDICQKRLCFKTSKETMSVVQMIVDEVKKIDSDLAEFCVPKCVYRNGLCNEHKSCGYINTPKFGNVIENYKNNFFVSKFV